MGVQVLINKSSNEISLGDLRGRVIAVNEQVSLSEFDAYDLKASADLVCALSAGDLILQDDGIIYNSLQAVDIVRGSPIRTTKYGTQIVASSDRPNGTYRYFTDSGDDKDQNIVGGGDRLMFDVPPTESRSVYVRFIRDTWIKDGQVVYENAAFGSYLTLEVVVPAGIPFPAIDGNGNFDLVGTNYVPNATNTGTLFILPVEATVFRFLNRYPLFSTGNGFGQITSPEPELVQKEITIKLTCHNAGTESNLKAHVLLGCFIPRTV